MTQKKLEYPGKRGRDLLEEMFNNQEEAVGEFVAMLQKYGLYDKKVYNKDDVHRYNSILDATIVGNPTLRTKLRIWYYF